MITQEWNYPVQHLKLLQEPSIGSAAWIELHAGQQSASKENEKRRPHLLAFLADWRLDELLSVGISNYPKRR